MAKKTYLADVDLSLNQLLQAKLENLPADPGTPTESRLYYNTVLKKIKYHNGTVWLTVIDDLDTRLTNARTPASHVIATNVGLGANHMISGAAVGWVLRASGATTANFQQLAHSDLADAGTNTHAQIDAHIGDATKHRQINDAGTSNTDLFSAAKILQLIADINTTVTGTLIFKGGYNAATDTTEETPSSNNRKLASAPIGAVTQGWTYVVTVDGTFFSEPVSAGDMLIAKQNGPTLLSHWTVVNKNIPDILVATETVAGIIEIATTAETAAGTDDTRAITPRKLKQALGTTGTLSLAKKYTQAIGDGTLLSIPVTHNLNTTGVTTNIYRTASPFDEVLTETKITSNNVVTFVFNVAPTAGQYTVVITG